jgi:hypothetical protein
LEDKKLFETLKAMSKGGVSQDSEELKKRTEEMNRDINSVIEFLSEGLSDLHCYVVKKFIYMCIYMCVCVCIYIYITWSFIVSTLSFH